MKGWIKLHRKFIGWEWYEKSEMVHLFIHLLLSANHDVCQWKGYAIKRGQVVVGLNKLHEKTGISIQTIRTCLLRLQKTQEINIKTNKQFTLITILEYDSYQDVEQFINKQSNEQLTNNQQTTNNKQEYKNDKNKRNNINISCFDFSFLEPEYEITFKLFLDYKKERNESYKSQKSIEAAYKRLKKFSKNSPMVAAEIVEQSMSNNWAGLFEIQTKKANSNEQKWAETKVDIAERIVNRANATFKEGRNYEQRGESQESVLKSLS